MVVEELLQKKGYTTESVILGEAVLKEDLDPQELAVLNQDLKRLGFELIASHKGMLVSQIKALIIDLVHHRETYVEMNLSDYLTGHLPYEYNYLSNVFSEQENNTIEKFHISQKTEKVKELLTYDELTLNQIAYQLGYSSAAHLSNQFKKVTGLTPGHFKAIKTAKRHNIEEL